MRVIQEFDYVYQKIIFVLFSEKKSNIWVSSTEQKLSAQDKKEKE